jgi:hypothetical protein
MDKSFSQVNEAFEALKMKFQAGELSRQAFIDEMKKLRIRDDEGRFWMIGAQTGKWYYFDGKDWIQSEPPSQKDSAAICVFCGFENRLDADACARCGGTIGEEPSKCPDCGSPLRKPFMTCPKCGTAPGGVTREESPSPTSIETAIPDRATRGTARAEIERSVAPTPEPPARTAAQPAIAPASAPGPAAGPSGELVIRSVEPASLFFFWGAFGLLAGILAGAFIGATGVLKPQLGFLPESLLQLQGTLFGALIDAVAGAALGFLALGSIAFVFGFLANLILALTGGIHLRTGRPEGSARKKKGKRSERLSLTADGGD